MKQYEARYRVYRYPKMFMNRDPGPCYVTEHIKARNDEDAIQKSRKLAPEIKTPECWCCKEIALLESIVEMPRKIF